MDVLDNPKGLGETFHLEYQVSSSFMPKNHQHGYKHGKGLRWITRDRTVLCWPAPVTFWLLYLVIFLVILFYPVQSVVFQRTSGWSTECRIDLYKCIAGIFTMSHLILKGLQCCSGGRPGESVDTVSAELRLFKLA